MKSNIVFLVGVLLVAGVCLYASSDGPAPKITWYSNYDLAVEQSTVTSKPLIILFTGSDWCRWCQKLESEVLDTEEFARIASEKFIFLKVDFPSRKSLSPQQKKHNEALKERFSIKGFPTLILLNEKQQKIATVGYREGGGSSYAKYLLNTVAQYTSYTETYHHAMSEEASSAYLEKLYRQARELGQDDDIDNIIAKGIESAEPVFFLKEKFRFLVEAGRIQSPEAQSIRARLLTADPNNEHGAHRNVAVIEFQRLAEELEVSDGDPAEACLPLINYINSFGEQDKDHLWRLQMTIAQTFLSKNRPQEALEYAKASYLSAPLLVRSEVANAIKSIETTMINQQ